MSSTDTGKKTAHDLKKTDFHIKNKIRSISFNGFLSIHNGQNTLI